MCCKPAASSCRIKYPCFCEFWSAPASCNSNNNIRIPFTHFQLASPTSTFSYSTESGQLKQAPLFSFDTVQRLLLDSNTCCSFLSNQRDRLFRSRYQEIKGRRSVVSHRVRVTLQVAYTNTGLHTVIIVRGSGKSWTLSVDKLNVH